MIIDVFPFFNEASLLNARLEYLGPFVDKFIIFESSIDFSGKSRKLFLNKEIVSNLPYAEKIEIHQWIPSYWFLKIQLPLVKFLKKNNGLWKIQNKQRNSVTNKLAKIRPDAILIFGDLDEFPDKNFIKDKLKLKNELNISPILSFSQTMFYYNTKTIMDNDWRGTSLCTISTAIKKTPRKIRKYRLDYPVVGKGWHFSYFSSSEGIKEKILAIADAENLTKYKSLTNNEIEAAIQNSKDLYNRIPPSLNNLQSHEIPEDLKKILKKYNIS